MRRFLIGILLGLTGSLLAVAAAHSSLGRGLEDQTYDWRVRATAHREDARPDIALILINESSLRALEPNFGGWPWPRVLHAGVIDFLARAPARVVAYDVLFVERDRRSSFDAGGKPMSGAASDGALVASVKAAGNVVLLADATFEGMSAPASQAAVVDSGAPKLPGIVFQPGQGFEKRPLRLPFPELVNAAAGIGHNFAVQGTDGVERRLWPFVDAAGVAVPSLGLEAALLAEHRVTADVHLDDRTLRIGTTRMPLLADPPPPRPGEPLESSRQVLLNFHGPYETAAGKTTYPVYSFFDVLLSEDRLESGATPAIDPAVFRNKIVLIGTSADGLGDLWTTPFRGGGMPGVQLHAALADDVLSSRFMRRSSPGVDIAWTVALGLVAGVMATLVPVAWAVPIALVIAASLGAWLTHQVGRGVWTAAVAPLAALCFAVFEGVAWQYFVEGRAKRRVTQLFGRYVSRDVFEHLMADPSVARLGGERRDMTVLFSDIRGFTSASEKGAPEAVVQQLNEYFTAMVDVLFRHQGTLDKFVGDMVMGIFGAPVADPRHADHAVAAAIDMLAALARLNAAWAAAGKPRLDIGIGISSGDMIAGNIGSDAIMSYTVIGDTVNLGARLESLNKEFGTRILMSEETKRRLTIDVKTRQIGDVTVKGKTRAVTVYEVIAP